MLDIESDERVDDIQVSKIIWKRESESHSRI